MSSIAIVNGAKQVNVGVISNSATCFVKEPNKPKPTIVNSYTGITTGVEMPQSIKISTKVLSTIVLNDTNSNFEYGGPSVSTNVIDDTNKDIFYSITDIATRTNSCLVRNYNKKDHETRFTTNQCLNALSTYVENKAGIYECVCNNISTVVSYENIETTESSAMFKSLSTDVIDDRDYEDDNHIPGGGSGTNATGGDLVELIITAQLMSFVEFKLKFHDKKVIDVSGLPDGLRYDHMNEKITGSPTKSGNYSIYVIFEDEKALKGRVHIPSLFRTI